MEIFLGGNIVFRFKIALHGTQAVKAVRGCLRGQGLVLIVMLDELFYPHGIDIFGACAVKSALP